MVIITSLKWMMQLMCMIINIVSNGKPGDQYSDNLLSHLTHCHIFRSHSFIA